MFDAWTGFDCPPLALTVCLQKRSIFVFIAFSCCWADLTDLFVLLAAPDASTRRLLHVHLRRAGKPDIAQTVSL